MSLLVSDYDSTLYTDERNMKLNVEALRDFIAKGNGFLLASGRSLASLMDRVQAYGIPFTYLSCCDGSFLYDKNQRLIRAYPISHDVVPIFSDLEKLGKHKKIEFSYSDDYATEYRPHDFIGSVAFTLDINDEDEEFKSVFGRIKDKHPEYQYDRYDYKDEVYYLIRPHGVNKAFPVRVLEEDFGFSKYEIYTIGDNTNDKEMIKEYNGFRIGSHPDVIDVALREYNAVHELIDDINKRRVLSRW